MLFPPVIGRPAYEVYYPVAPRQGTDTPTDTSETETSTTPTSESTPSTSSTPTTTSSTSRTTPTTTRTSTSTATPPTTPGVTPTSPTSTPTPTVSGVTNTITDATGGLTTIVTSIIIGGQTTTIVYSTGTPVPVDDSKGGNSNVGTIVGASVGGVIALALIGLIWFILARKRRERRHKQYENDIFDPDHTIRGPNFDLGAGPGPETIPDPYTFDDRHNGQPQMQQYHPAYDQYAVAGAGGYAASGPGHPMSPTHYPHDAASATSAGYTTPGLAGVGVAGALAAGAYGQNRHSGESGTPTTEAFSTGSSGQPLTGRAAKEREAFSRSGRMSQSTASPVLAPGISPQATGNGSAYGPGAAYNYGMGTAPTATSGSHYSSESGAAGSPVRSQQSHAPFRGGLGVANPDQIRRTGTPGSGVVVHQDAGRVHEDDDDEHDLAELPPTYASIPVDERSRGGPSTAGATAPDAARPVSSASAEARPASVASDAPRPVSSSGTRPDAEPHVEPGHS